MLITNFGRAGVAKKRAATIAAAANVAREEGTQRRAGIAISRSTRKSLLLSSSGDHRGPWQAGKGQSPGHTRNGRHMHPGRWPRWWASVLLSFITAGFRRSATAGLMWRDSPMKQMLFKGSAGRFESPRSWFTTTVALPKFRRRKTMTRTSETTRSEDGADLTYAIREYEEPRKHTADVSKPAWRRSKGRHGTLIGHGASGAEAHSLLTAEPTLTK